MRLGRAVSRESSHRSVEEWADHWNARAEIGRPAVLDVINVHARGALIDAAVELVDPVLRLLDVSRLRRDEEDRVDALDRDHLDNRIRADLRVPV